MFLKILIFINNLTFLDLYPWADAFMKLWSKWCMLIWGRALIRTWALVQRNTVSHLAKNFSEWVISLMIIFSKITVRALISSNLQSPITRIGDSSWSFNSYALESTQLFLLQRNKSFLGKSVAISLTVQIFFEIEIDLDIIVIITKANLWLQKVALIKFPHHVIFLWFLLPLFAN